jgi:hypothetical protein
MSSRLLLVLAASFGWSGLGRAESSEPAFDWWRRSVRRSLTIAAVVTFCVLALPLLVR